MKYFTSPLVLLAILTVVYSQRPIIIPVEYGTVPSTNRHYNNPPAANTRSQTRPGSASSTFNSPSAPVPNRNAQTFPNPNAYNSNGHNLTFVISAANLPNTDVLDNIDPYIKVYFTNKTNAEPEKFGTTETLKDTITGEFITVISFLWKRGEGQKWTFKVKDSDNLRDTTVAEGILDVDDYVNKGEIANITLKSPDGKPVSGTLLIRKTTPIRFRLYARNLPRSDAFNGKSDPFVKCFWRRGPNGSEVKFYQTKVENDVENADWNETIEFPNYIKGTDLWWVFKVKDSDPTGEDDLGEALVEIDPFVEKRQTKPVRLGKTGTATLSITPV